jgi:hypothetical protein
MRSLHEKLGDIEHLHQLPKTVPHGRILVHNNVRPTERPGTRGFRAWLQPPTHNVQVCPCGWAPELGPHYFFTWGFGPGSDRPRFMADAPASSRRNGPRQRN